MSASARPSNLASAEKLSEHLSLAEKASMNPALIPNHLDTGVASWLRHHLAETCELLAMSQIMPDAFDDEFVARLTSQKQSVTRALSVYESASGGKA